MIPQTSVNWTAFNYKYSTNPQHAFESLTYYLFCHEFQQPYGIFRYFNQPHIETNPIHVGDRILALETENKELQQKLTELTQELSKQKADADMGLQQCKAQAELTMERALFKKEREMQELLRQADKENARLEVLLEQAREQLKKENIDKDEQ